MTGGSSYGLLVSREDDIEGNPSDARAGTTIERQRDRAVKRVNPNTWLIRTVDAKQ